MILDASNLAERTEVVLQIIQCCVHPRAKLSLPDAVFTAHFVRKMHALNTDGFQTIIFYDKVCPSLAFRRLLLMSCIVAATERTTRTDSVLLHRERSSKLLSVKIPVSSIPITDDVSTTARFLFEMLTDVNRWYNDAKTYKEECTGPRYHGFLQKWPKSSTTVSAESDFYSHGQYRSLVERWQGKMLEVRSSTFVELKETDGVRSRHSR